MSPSLCVRPFFPEDEFDSIFGLSRSEVAAVADQWPVVLNSNCTVKVAIGSAMNTLIGYPIKAENLQHWDEYISADRRVLVAILEAWVTKRADHK